jgi:ferredoxin
MAKDLSKQQWHGIPRPEIPWYPSINEASCIGCELCYVTCGREVRKEAKEKRDKSQITQLRAQVEQQMAQKTSQVRMQVAGEFGEKQFLVQLWNFLEGRPYDIVNLKLEIPTVMGAKEKAPSFMQFDVIPTETEDVLEFLKELRDLILKNGLVVVAEQKL